jgi:hypothetical protein
MGLSAIVQIADRLLSRSAEEDRGNLPRARNPRGADQERSNRTDFGDQFTQSGPANGSAASEEILTAEFFRVTAFAAQIGAPPSAPLAAQPVNPAANAGPAIAANPATPPATAVTVAPVTVTAAVPAPATTPANHTQADLQALNSSLSALGLNAAEIAAFDQFAALLLQFDPNGLAELQNELNLLATRFQAQSGAAGNTPQTPAASNSATQPAAPANTPGFQLSELSISFASVSAGNSRAGGGSQFSAFSLQIQEISVTLGAPSGQTTQIQVSPSANSPAATQAAPALATAATAAPNTAKAATA